MNKERKHQTYISYFFLQKFLFHSFLFLLSTSFALLQFFQHLPLLDFNFFLSPAVLNTMTIFINFKKNQTSMYHKKLWTYALAVFFCIDLSTKERISEISMSCPSFSVAFSKSDLSTLSNVDTSASVSIKKIREKNSKLSMHDSVCWSLWNNKENHFYNINSISHQKF